MNYTLQHLHSLLNIPLLIELSIPASTSFMLIIAAEIGDKSQLVCMSLAARHRATPVLLGATAAFALLNSLAVIFGAAISNWLPSYIISASVAVLFVCYGLHSIFGHDDNEEEDEKNLIKKKSHHIFFTTFLLITVAEFGDKTQLAVVALSSTYSPIAVWFGATLALVMSSLLGIIIGKKVLKKFPIALFHKISGAIFVILAALAAYNTYINYQTSF